MNVRNLQTQLYHPRRLLAGAALFIAGCAAPTPWQPPESRAPTPADSRALIARLLPPTLADRTGWAAEIYAAMTALAIAPSAENVCAVVAVTEQESGFRVDPAIPNLGEIARKEIERQRERAGVPSLVLQAALALPSTDGRSYAARVDAAKTELELSNVFEDFIGRVPLARTFLAERNPVRTGGPMQVGVAFARAHAEAKPYPYVMNGSLRHEVFTRRGGMYFGIAHLLDYPAAYDAYLYRFADYNAGRYASRNAAFQKVVGEATGIALELDGDLLRFDKSPKDPGATERAVRVLAGTLEMDEARIRRDLELGKSREFEATRLYTRVFAVADKARGRKAPRAVMPQIKLQSSKFSRNLTTEWFAKRVEARFRTCLLRKP